MNPLFSNKMTKAEMKSYYFAFETKQLTDRIQKEQGVTRKFARKLARLAIRRKMEKGIYQVS